MADVTLVLTFDDGPHAAASTSSANLSVRVRNILRSNRTQPGILAAFFVQTHVAHRMANPSGRQVVVDAHDAGHLIEIHTGSTTDHTSHRTRVTQAAFDADGDGQVDGQNALESDMTRAIQRIENATGATPQFVRAVGGATNAAVLATYNRVGLKHVLWDVDSEDNHAPRPPATSIRQRLRRQIGAKVGAGAETLVILFHDINSITASNLESYIDTIARATRDAGADPLFADDRDRIDEIFRARHDGN